MCEDRISQLPDAILQQILSLIDINEAVETSILSTRWKNLCFSLSDLKFHLSRFAAHRGGSLRRYEAAQDFSHRFSEFVSHFLSHRDAATTIRSFHLSFGSSLVCPHRAFLEECVHYAINHGIQSLHLHAHSSLALRLPASQTLRELNLITLTVVISKHFSLPHLKTLYLESSSFVNDDTECCNYSKEPFSGFPELEKLTLRHFWVSGLVVKAPKLRFLEIIQPNLYPHHQGMILEEISAPLLVSFRYEGLFPLECSKVELPMLEEVYLHIYKGMKIEKGVHLKCVRMLEQLGNAKIVALTLTLDTLKILEMDGGVIEQRPCPFPYIKCLKLMKGRREIRMVLQSVMKYLTMGNLNYESLMVEFPADHSVAVVDEISEDVCDDHNCDELEYLFD